METVRYALNDHRVSSQKVVERKTGLVAFKWSLAIL